MGIAQRRAAKALRRKAIVKVKRRTAAAGDGKSARRGGWSVAPPLATHKASAALIDVADILTNDEDDRDTRYKCLMLAMVAWNVSLLAVEERREKLRDFFDAMPGLGADGEQFADKDGVFSSFEDMMAQLISRKILLYPFDRRWLLNLDVIETSDGYRVNVASALDAAA